MKKKLMGIFFAGVAIFIAGKSLQAQDQTGTKQSANRIVGAWETTVQPRNCETGEALGPAFPGVITFNLGGTVAEYGANPATPYRTPGHGIWAIDGGGSIYSMKFSFIALTPAGAPVGRMRVTQDLELSRFSDESSSRGSFVLTNFAGVIVATGCSTSTAVRLAF